MGARYVFKPRQVLSGLKKLGFEVLPGRGKGDHLFLVRSVTCRDGERHTVKALVDATAPAVHPKAVAMICARTGLTPEKLRDAAKGNYSRAQYEQDMLQIPKIDLLSPDQRASYLKTRK